MLRYTLVVQGWTASDMMLVLCGRKCPRVSSCDGPGRNGSIVGWRKEAATVSSGRVATRIGDGDGGDGDVVMEHSAGR